MANVQTKSAFTTKERRIMIVTAIALFFLLFFNLFGQAYLNKINFEVENLKDDVQAQEQVNEVLTMKRDELSSYARIDAAAKAEGLTYNNNNIKIVD